MELARLQYLSTRLVRRWSHLERQTGGAGVRGGPGEKQIELDKRMIGEAIKRTKERLGKVKKQRQTQRRQRERRNSFTISLVGYTNAGKSTLFNALVKARAYAADQLFATLDTTTRQLYLATPIVRCPCRTLSVLSATSRTALWTLLPPPCRRPPMQTCCCMWSMVPIPITLNRSNRCSVCSTRSGPRMCRKSWCSTNSMPLKNPVGRCN